MSKQNPTPGESAVFDGNQVASLVVKQGTAGTADIVGTSLSMGLSGDPATGALYTTLLNSSAANPTAGTLNLVGTINTIGTLPAITIGTVPGIGTLTNVGSLTNAGTIKEISNIAGGTLFIGTVGGKAASGVAAVANPIQVAGTDAGGTIYSPLVTSTGAQLTGLTSSGTLLNLASGTLAAVTAVTTVSNLTNGSVNILTGTLQSAGTTTGVGVVSSVTNLVGGTLFVGTIGGKAASGVVAVANPVLIAGTDAGGTVYAPMITTGGIQKMVDTAGTIATMPQVSVGTLPVVSLASSGTLLNLASGTLAAVTSVTNLAAGTITAVNSIVAGTQNTLGTVGVVNNIVTGTLANSGTTTGVGVVTTVTTVSNLTNGSVNLLTGTVTRLSNVGTVESGTIQLNPVPVPATLQFGTLGTAGGSFFGTLSAASGAGTKHYITGVDIVVNTGTADVRVLAGTSIQGTGVLAAGAFPAGGGISKRITPAFATGTNSELIYHFVGAGTAFINVSYWKGV